MGMRNRFDILRERAQQQGTAQGQENVDALQRRFASLGNLNSGAAIKQEQLAKQQAGEQAAQGVQNVDLAEQDYNTQQENIQKERDFQAGEQQKQRDFGAAENEKQRAFGKEQAMFGAGEAQKQRDFQKMLSDQDFSFKEKVFGAENSARDRQLNLAFGEYERDSKVTALNALFQGLAAQKEYKKQLSGPNAGTQKYDINALINSLTGIR